jgi:hypothetical protein
MRLFPQGVYFRSHMVWFRNNMMQSQNDTSDFRNNMQENGKEHKRKYPVFPTWQSVISEICNVVSKQHVKFRYHICSLETVIGPKSTLNNMPYFRLYMYQFWNHMCVFRFHAPKIEKLIRFHSDDFRNDMDHFWIYVNHFRIYMEWEFFCQVDSNTENS